MSQTVLGIGCALTDEQIDEATESWFFRLPCPVCGDEIWLERSDMPYACSCNRCGTVLKIALTLVPEQEDGS